MTDFVVGELYTRDQVAERIAMPIERRGGAWDTGYDEWQGEAFIFTNVGVAGRTGHDYSNRFEGKDLIWFGKSRAKRGQPQIDRLISNQVPVHIFWRGQDRSPFTYAGVGEAVEATGDVPVKVLWAFKRGAPAEVQATSLLDPEPIWRRGPPPFTGPAIANHQDGETVVYLMRLEGAVRAVVEIPDGHYVIKIGMSNKVERRLTELNVGFPPNSKLRWALVRTLTLASGPEAFSLEGRCLEELRRAGYWTGGEFAVVPQASFDRLLV